MAPGPVGAVASLVDAGIFTGGAISLKACRHDLYQKYKAGELGWNWETAAEVGAAVFSAAVCVASGKGMVGEAKKLGRMMKEDNVVGRLKESVGRFDCSQEPIVVYDAERSP